jgi:hypothetical protein
MLETNDESIGETLVPQTPPSLSSSSSSLVGYQTHSHGQEMAYTAVSPNPTFITPSSSSCESTSFPRNHDSYDILLPSSAHGRASRKDDLPILSLVDSNTGSLSAITTAGRDSDLIVDEPSCPWSGIPSPSPSFSHHPKDDFSPFTLLPMKSSLSSSSSSSFIPNHTSNQPPRRIFLENLTIQLQVIDTRLQQRASSSRFTDVDVVDDDILNAEEILDDLESDLETLRDLDTIQTRCQSLLLVLRETSQDDETSSPNVNSSAAAANDDDYDTSPTVVHAATTTTTTFSDPVAVAPPNAPPLEPCIQDYYYCNNNNRSGPLQVQHSAKVIKDDAAMMASSSPSTIYPCPEDGETEPTTMSTLSLESSGTSSGIVREENPAPPPPLYQSSWQDDKVANDTLGQDSTFSTLLPPPVELAMNEISQQWNEIGTLINSNMKAWALAKQASHTTTTTGRIHKPHPWDQPISKQPDTLDEDQDTILHALARIYARLFLKPRSAQQRPPLSDNGVSKFPATLLHDRREDETVEEAIHRISMRVQLETIRLLEERRQLCAEEKVAWPRPHGQKGTITQDVETNQVDRLDPTTNNEAVMDDWFDNLLIMSNEWCTTR